MASRRFSLWRVVFLAAIVALCLFSVSVSAQDDTKTTTTDNADAKTTDTKTTDTKTTATDKTTSTPTDKTTSTTSTTSATGKTTLPNLSTSSTSTSSETGTRPKLTGMPTVSKTVDNTIPTYPPPAVPPTVNAPFMHRSTLPDGTVFIAVGAILGAFGAAVVVWRGIVACLLHRSVERAALEQHAATDKAMTFPAPPNPFYKYSDRDSSPSLAVGSTNGRGVRRSHRGPTPSTTPSQSNLFFSPTATAGGVGSMNSANRDSRFLPSGFYAAGAASPGGSNAPFAHHTSSISLSNLRPDSRGHPRAVSGGISPPDSPGLAPTGPAMRTTSPGARNLSTSSFNLYAPSQGRTPSAYLEDLLDEQGALPPPPPRGDGQGSHGRTYSQSSLGRF